MTEPTALFVGYDKCVRVKIIRLRRVFSLVVADSGGLSFDVVTSRLYADTADNGVVAAEINNQLMIIQLAKEKIERLREGMAKHGEGEA